MCFVEFNWTANAWQFRIGDYFTDFQGERSFPVLADWRDYLASRGCVLTKVTGRVYEVKCAIPAKGA